MAAHYRRRRHSTIDEIEPPSPKRRRQQPPQSTRNSLEPLISSRSSFAKEDIRAAAALGGPDVTDLRGFPSPDICTTIEGSPEMPNTNTSAYSGSFVNTIKSKGVQEAGRNNPPQNRDEILERLEVPRASLSPSRFTDDDVLEFQQQLRHIRVTESGLQAVATPVLLGKFRYNGLYDLPFISMKPPVSVNNTTIPKPDYYLGTSPDTIPQAIRDDLRTTIEPSNNREYPLLPNFFIEYKPPSGNSDVAERQAVWDGCHGARAVQAYQSYDSPKPIIDEVARTFSITVNADHVQIYSHHVSAPTSFKTPVYHTTMIDSSSLGGVPSKVRQTIAMTRNCADLADELRDSVISATDQRLRQLLDEDEGSALPSPPSTRRQTAHSKSNFSPTRMSSNLNPDVSPILQSTRKKRSVRNRSSSTDEGRAKRRSTRLLGRAGAHASGLTGL